MSLKRLRAWRLDRAELEMADAEYYYDRWVEPFDRRLGTVSPGEKRRARQRIEKARRRVEELSAGLPKRGEKP